MLHRKALKEQIEYFGRKNSTLWKKKFNYLGKKLNFGGRSYFFFQNIAHFLLKSIIGHFFVTYFIAVDCTRSIPLLKCLDAKQSSKWDDPVTQHLFRPCIVRHGLHTYRLLRFVASFVVYNDLRHTTFSSI